MDEDGVEVVNLLGMGEAVVMMIGYCVHNHHRDDCSAMCDIWGGVRMEVGWG